MFSCDVWLALTGAPAVTLESAQDAEDEFDVCCCCCSLDWVGVVAGELVSAFNDGKLAGGRRAEGTLPKLCIPCLRGTAFFNVVGSDVSP